MKTETKNKELIFIASATDALKECASALNIAAEICKKEEVQIPPPEDSETKEQLEAVIEASVDTENISPEKASEITAQDEPETETRETPAEPEKAPEITEEPAPVEETKEPPVEEPVTITDTQRNEILELLKAGDLPKGYADGVRAEMDDFTFAKAASCIKWLYAKKYLPKKPVPERSLAFKKLLMEIDIPPGGYYISSMKIWNLFGKYGVTNEKSIEVLKEMDLPFATKKELCDGGTQEQLIAFIQLFEDRKAG